MRRWILYSNLHIVPVAAGFVSGTYALAGTSADPAYVLLACCGAFLVYQWDRASGMSPEDEVNVPERSSWLRHHRGYVLISSAVALAGAVWAVSVSSVFVRYAAAALGLVGMIYAAPVLLGRRPKDVHRLKNVLIAACWVTGGVVVPLIESNAPTVVILWLVIHRLFCIAPDLVTADLVDRRGDIAAGVCDDVRIHQAHPQRVAVRSLAAAATLALVAVVSGWSPSGAGGFLLVAVDMLGPAGTAWTLRRIERLHHRHVVLLDMWVAFPLVTWLASLCM